MMPRLPVSALRRLAMLAVLAAPLPLLGGCFGGAREPERFKRPSYAYLPPLYVKVARIKTVDLARPAPGSLAAQMPTPLDQRAALMARERLQPRGGAGTGTLTVLGCSVEKSRRVYNGYLQVRLVLQNPDMGGSSTIVATIRDNVTRTGSDSVRRALYDLGAKMMSDLNVELEYQLRDKLARWLTSASGSAGDAREGVRAQALPPV